MEHYTEPAKDQEQVAQSSQQERWSPPLDLKEARRQLGWALLEAQRQWRSR